MFEFAIPGGRFIGFLLPALLLCAQAWPQATGAPAPKKGSPEWIVAKFYEADEAIRFDGPKSAPELSNPQKLGRYAQRIFEMRSCSDLDIERACKLLDERNDFRIGISFAAELLFLLIYTTGTDDWSVDEDEFAMIHSPIAPPIGTAPTHLYPWKRLANGAWVLGTFSYRWQGPPISPSDFLKRFKGMQRRKWTPKDHLAEFLD